MKRTKFFKLVILTIFAFAVILGGVSCSDDSSDDPVVLPNGGNGGSPAAGGLTACGEAPVITGCQTYVGLHPTEPENSDTQEFELCDDGTASKTWNPAAVSSPELPGVMASTGTYTLTGNTLAIDTTGTIMAVMSSNIVETYEVFTYDSGNKLSIYGATQDVASDSLVGAWSGGFTVETVMTGGGMDAEMDAITTDAVTVNADGTWTNTRTIDVTCTPSTGMVCGMFPSGITTEVTSGTWDATDDILPCASGEIIFNSAFPVLDLQ